MAELLERDVLESTPEKQLEALKLAFHALNGVTAIYYWDREPDRLTAKQMYLRAEEALDKMKGVLE